MTLTYMRWTRKGGDVANLFMNSPENVREDYCVVDAYSSQNRLRHALSVLDRTVFAGFSTLPDLWDLSVTYDPNQREYRLWCYCRNWKGRASFLAGVIVGKSYKWKAVERRLRRRKNRGTV